MTRQLEQIKFTKRDAEKNAYRNHGIHEASKGVSAKLLRTKNFMFSGIDMSKIIIETPNGLQLSHPSLKK